jgi:hypothetical protein
MTGGAKTTGRGATTTGVPQQGGANWAKTGVAMKAHIAAARIRSFFIALLHLKYRNPHDVQYSFPALSRIHAWSLQTGHLGVMRNSISESTEKPYQSIGL